MDSVGEGEGGKIWENGIETCKISFVVEVKEIPVLKELMAQKMKSDL